MEKIDFLLAGVGGQGALTASDILAEVGMLAGYDVKKSEVHGFAQRGGVVESHVRWGVKVLSTLGEKSRVDYLLALEKLEGARWATYLKPGGVAIVNEQHLLPLSVTASNATYPEDNAMEAALLATTDKVYYVDALQVAASLGTPKAANTVLLGFVSTFLDVAPDLWLRVIKRCVPPQWSEVNKRAFSRGRELATQAQN